MAYTSDREAEELILSRLGDLTSRCERQQRPCFLGFLDEFQQKVCRDALRRNPLCHRFFGGYEDAERLFLGVSPWEEGLADTAFPIACVGVRSRPQDGLSHRDFLGSVMGLSLKREAVGDILVEEGFARVYLSSAVKEAVLSQLTKVGRAGVTCEEVPLGGRAARQYEALSGTVSSLRLDCAAAFLAGLSRSSAAALVSGGLAAVDGQTVTDPTRILRPGEKISIRGTGKFLFDGELGTGRKGRLRVLFRKYS